MFLEIILDSATYSFDRVITGKICFETNAATSPRSFQIQLRIKGYAVYHHGFLSSPSHKHPTTASASDSDEATEIFTHSQPLPIPAGPSSKSHAIDFKFKFPSKSASSLPCSKSNDSMVNICYMLKATISKRYAFLGSSQSAKAELIMVPPNLAGKPLSANSSFGSSAKTFQLPEFDSVTPSASLYKQPSFNSNPAPITTSSATHTSQFSTSSSSSLNSVHTPVMVPNPYFQYNSSMTAPSSSSSSVAPFVPRRQFSVSSASDPPQTPISMSPPIPPTPSQLSAFMYQNQQSYLSPQSHYENPLSTSSRPSPCCPSTPSSAVTLSNGFDSQSNAFNNSGTGPPMLYKFPQRSYTAPNTSFNSQRRMSSITSLPTASFCPVKHGASPPSLAGNQPSPLSSPLTNSNVSPSTICSPDNNVTFVNLAPGEKLTFKIEPNDLMDEEEVVENSNMYSIPGKTVAPTVCHSSSSSGDFSALSCHRNLSFSESLPTAEDQVHNNHCAVSPSRRSSSNALYLATLPMGYERSNSVSYCSDSSLSSPLPDDNMLQDPHALNMAYAKEFDVLINEVLQSL